MNVFDKPIEWNDEKNNFLIKERGLSFEKIVVALMAGHAMASYPHPKIAHQKIVEIELDGYVVVVPYVENGKSIFLKTAFHSRKATKNLKRGSKL